MTDLDLSAAILEPVFRRMLEAYGPQHWWPGDTPFEVMVGAVLTQNTAWSNVEPAIANLVRLDALSAERILALPLETLAEALRPSGYFNLKTKRLRALCALLLESGGESVLARLPTAELRQRLLGVNGIGPETADDILLYAFERPVFVIDAYTRRIFRRLGRLRGEEPYEDLRRAFEQALGPDVPRFNEYHGLIVRHAKEACGPRAPRCASCCLAQLCARGGGLAPAR